MVSVLRNRSGFTLIEVLVVMAVIALLLTIALPRYFGSLEKSKEVVLKENLQVMRVTLDKFYADRGRYPQTLEELVTEKYLRNVPVDPMTESAQTWRTMHGVEGESTGIMDVHSGAVGKTKDGIPYEDL